MQSDGSVWWVPVHHRGDRHRKACYAFSLLGWSGRKPRGMGIPPHSPEEPFWRPTKKVRLDFRQAEEVGVRHLPSRSRVAPCFLRAALGWQRGRPDEDTEG